MRCMRLYESNMNVYKCCRLSECVSANTRIPQVGRQRVPHQHLVNFFVFFAFLAIFDEVVGK